MSESNSVVSYLKTIIYDNVGEKFHFYFHIAVSVNVLFSLEKLRIKIS